VVVLEYKKAAAYAHTTARIGLFHYMVLSATSIKRIKDNIVKQMIA